MSTNERFKIARNARGMTQGELAQAVGVSDKAPTTWERENSPVIPRPQTLMQVANCLGVPVDYFTDESVDINLPFQLRNSMGWVTRAKEGQIGESVHEYRVVPKSQKEMEQDILSELMKIRDRTELLARKVDNSNKEEVEKMSEELRKIKEILTDLLFL